MLTVGIGTFMKKRKEDKVREIRKLFKKLGVLTIEDLYDVIGTTQRRTVLRYIKELKYLTSYTLISLKIIHRFLGLYQKHQTALFAS